VAAIAEAYGLGVKRRSEHAALGADITVLIGDSMGEMFAYYAACDVAFIGGSLLDYGSQNPIEACAVGAPLLIGPSVFNFAEVARAALASGAARRVDNATELVHSARVLLADAAARAAMAEAGRSFAARHRGASAKTLALLEPFLAAPAERSP
jgi:3-deoxy-D-manno-octulosonic-acid transferase